MKKLILSFILIVALLIIGFFILIRQEENQGHRVLDCSRGPGNCEYKLIEYNIEDCEPWTNNCKKTKEGLKEVSMIADEANYISAPFTDQKFTVELINIKLERPWDLEFLPDDSILITEQVGRILHIKDNREYTSLILPTISLSESGLLGLAIDPDFSSNNYVYIYYTYKTEYSDHSFLNPKHDKYRRVLNKISRLTFKNGLLTDETVLIDNIPGTLQHSGSRLEFGPDGKLYATTGDAEELLLAQDHSFLGGKILRLNPDGSIPKDNPFPGSYVYSRGHRNPQGLAWHPVSKELYASEHGPWRYDEINHIRPGQNYGWGAFKCDKKNFYITIQGEVVFPIVCFKEWTMAPSGMEFVSDPESPWFGSLFVASLRGKHLHRYVFDNDEIIIDEIFFVSNRKEYTRGEDKGKISKRIRDVEYHDGSLYVIGDRFGMVKITPK